MGHDIGDSCNQSCDNCGVVFCTERIKICPVCGTVPWIFDGGARKKEFNEWFDGQLKEIKRKEDLKKVVEKARERAGEQRKRQAAEEKERLQRRTGV